MNTEPFTISAVVPVYGCRECLQELCVQLERNLSILTDRYEIILVDDRSPDNWWQLLPELQKRHPSLKAIRLSRNYGQQIAITAGLAAAKGDYAVVMDCDLQDPPDLIPALFAKLREGYDLVLARRVSRSHSMFRQVAAKVFVRISSMLTNERIDGSYGSYSILSRKVVDSFLLFEEKERYYLSILRWLGFNIGAVDFVHQDRHSGRSSYGLRNLFRVGVNGILLQATVALHWIVGFGFFVAISGAVTAAYLVWRQIFHASMPGWTSLIVLMLLCTGVILISLGFVGLYIGKIFEQTRGRPLYVVDTVKERRLPW